MTEEKEYFDNPAPGSGVLSRYWNGGNYSPDHALRKLDWMYAFEMGHMFERMVQDEATGSKLFLDGYFVSEGGDPSEKTAKLIREGEELEYKLTLKGDWDKRQSTHNHLVEECRAAPGRMPVGQEAFKTLKALVDSCMACQLAAGDDRFPARSILTNSAFRWQVPIYWEEGGIKKKALVDGLLVVPDEFVIIIDFKYSGTWSNARRAMQSRYWIQAAHYEEGVAHEYGLPVMPMMFLVGCPGDKNEPPLVECMTVKNRDACAEEYGRLIEAYARWIASGGEAKGFLEPREQWIHFERK